jgi:lipid-A-disaccharide synthase|tara:strand:- start:4122 stop:5273 length:1152 start_codon:yes stop_codon:yes gene_type:complete
MKIVIITGEESGDELGASLVDALKQSSIGEFELYGIGGSLLLKRGINNFHNISEINVMGIVEVVPKILKIKKIINNVTKQVAELKPDIVITIDSPDFTLRVANKIKSINPSIKIIHYVAPSIWGWRPKRVFTVKSAVNHLLTILPFEKKLFEKEGIATSFVGHPITHKKKPDITFNQFNEKYLSGNTKPILLILPGSRKPEIDKLLNIYLKAIESFNFYKDFSIVLPIKKSLSKYIEQLIIGKNINFKITILDDEEAKYESFVVADYAIATSGTVALELSYFNIAYLVAYKFNFLSYVIIKMLAQAKFANLINIINDKKVIPELIQSECSINNIGQTLEKIINDNKYKNNILNASANAIKQLRSTAAPSDLAADEVIRLIKND